MNEDMNKVLQADRDNLPRAYIILNGAKPHTLPFRLGMRRGCPLWVKMPQLVWWHWNHRKDEVEVGDKLPMFALAVPEKPLPSAKLLGTRYATFLFLQQ